MASPFRYEERILKAAREHFAAHGFFGARVDAIADEAKLNKRMVYEYNHTKEGLYLAVLSRVSLDFMDVLNQKLPVSLSLNEVRPVFVSLFEAAIEVPDFVRLWVWETMDETIHGPRVLETMNEVFKRLRSIIDNCAKQGACEIISDAAFEKLVVVCHGYFLTMALSLRNMPGIDNPEPLENIDVEDLVRARQNLQYVKELQEPVIQCISQILGLDPGFADNRQ